MFEGNGEGVAVHGDAATAAGEEEAQPVAVPRLDVVPVVLGGDEVETDPALRVAADGERIGSIIVGGLDVVLVGVRPVQFDLLSVVRKEIGRAFAVRAAPAGEEVPFVVVTREELGEVPIDLAFGRGAAIRSAGEAERTPNPGKQLVVEESRNFCRLHLHDPVEAEVEIAPVQLEHLPEQGAQSLEARADFRGRFGVLPSPTGRRRIAHREGS